MLAKDFIRVKLNWTRYIQQGNRIGRNTKNGKDRHVRVTLKSIEDKMDILKNIGLLQGAHIYLDDELTPKQQDERRKEWEKVKSERDVGKWAWLKNGKVQVSERLTNQK